MKLLSFFFVLNLFTLSLYAQQDGMIDDPGDIAFVAYHDDDDGFSFVFTDDCPNGTSIRFIDEEWDGSMFVSATSEGEVLWTNTTGAVIPAGTVIHITDADDNDLGIAASLGTASEVDGGFTTGEINDQIYAVTGTRAMPGTFLAFVGSLGNGVDIIASLANTGLTNGTTANVIGDNEGYYSGSTNCNGTLTQCLQMINNSGNWTMGAFTYPGGAPSSFQLSPPPPGCADTARCLPTLAVALNAMGEDTISSNDVNNGSTVCPGHSLYLDDSTFTCTDVGTVTIYLIADDNMGDRDSCQVMVMVSDTTPPVVPSLSDTSVQCANDPLLTNTVMRTATDACDGNINASNVDMQQNIICANQFEVVRKWYFTDNSGNTDSTMRLITVNDTTRPTITPAPGSPPAQLNVSHNDTLDYECGDPNIPVFDATHMQTMDNCDNPTPGFTVTTPTQNCTDGTITCYEWTATDACNNSNLFRIVIRETDNTPPQLNGVPSNINLICPAPIPPATVTATDACDGDLGVIQPVIDTLPGKNGSCYRVRRRWIATDACNNTTKRKQIIKYYDNTPPVITPDPYGPFNGASNGDIVDVPCTDLPIQGDPMDISDACCLQTTNFFEALVANGDCATDGYFKIYKCTWQAFDCCGNMSEFYIYMKVVPANGDCTASCEPLLPPPSSPPGGASASGTQPVSTDNTLRVYPNPVGNVLYIDLNKYSGNSANIEIYNGYGTIVHAKKATLQKNTPYQISAATFLTGVYYVLYVVKMALLM